MEICRNNTWGTVCHNGWQNVDAKVVCRQLGFSVSGNTYICIIELGQVRSGVEASTPPTPLDRTLAMEPLYSRRFGTCP